MQADRPSRGAFFGRLAGAGFEPVLVQHQAGEHGRNEGGVQQCLAAAGSFALPLVPPWSSLEHVRLDNPLELREEFSEVLPKEANKNMVHVAD